MLNRTLLLEDNSPYISYAGNWAYTYSNPAPRDPEVTRYSSANFHCSNTTGDSASLTWTGTDIVIHGARRFNHGWYSVSLDSGDKVYYDGRHIETQQYQYPIFNGTGLSDGLHTIVLTNECWKDPTRTTDGQLNVYVDIDFIQVHGTPIIQSSSTSSTASKSSSSNSSTSSSPSKTSSSTSLSSVSTSRSSQKSGMSEQSPTISTPLWAQPPKTAPIDLTSVTDHILNTGHRSRPPITIFLLLFVLLMVIPSLSNHL
ncbi:hypothetical protein M231_05079 [Tremella mesenterica]|uniref:Uncharacterized protein n=1 Tax=Tremella mesenterica TaxID=5217 RepID=A0A4V1M3Q3_TREME|nr:hypothetical protein M231_05079 [Tremella mesenterica]